MNLAGVFRSFAVVWLCCSLSLVQAADENQSETTTVYSLGEVVVSAEMPAAETIPVVEITAAEIEKRHVTTLEGALELLPGIDVRRGGRVSPESISAGSGAGTRSCCSTGFPSIRPMTASSIPI